MMNQNKKIGLLGTLGLAIGASAAVSGLLLRRWAKRGSGEVQLGGLNGKGITLKKLKNGSIVLEPWQTVTAAEEPCMMELNEEEIQPVDCDETEAERCEET